MSVKDSIPSTPDDSLQKKIEWLSVKYPLIASNGELGEPHLAGTRFAVANVLSSIIAFGSLNEVIDQYDDQYTPEQLTQAIQFSRDFLNLFFRYADRI